VPGCGPDYAAEEFFSCPLAESSQPWVADMMRVWQLCKVEGVSLSTIIERPSSALLSGVAAVDAAVGAAHRLDAERHRSDAGLAGKAAQHQRAWR